MSEQIEDEDPRLCPLVVKQATFQYRVKWREHQESLAVIQGYISFTVLRISILVSASWKITASVQLLLSFTCKPHAAGEQTRALEFEV